MYELWLMVQEGSRFGRSRQIGTLTDPENAEAAADGICAHYLDAGDNVGISVRRVGDADGVYVYTVSGVEIRRHREQME